MDRKRTTLLALLLAPLCLPAQEKMYQEFLDPPADARPHVYWHWMNGNISKDGIRKDLLWLHRAGIRGFNLFDAGLETPQIVEHRIPYMTPEWNDAFRYAVGLADSLGMETSIASSPGWSVTGGPWVPDADGMKKVVWRQADVAGGQRITLALPEGFRINGVYQNFNIKNADITSTFKEARFYRDIAVLAVRLPAEEVQPRVTYNGQVVDGAGLADDDVMDFASFAPNAPGSRCEFIAEYPRPTLVKSLSYVAMDASNQQKTVEGELWYEAEGGFAKLCDLYMQSSVEHTYNIRPTRAKRFKLVFFSKAGNMGGKPLRLSKLVFSPFHRVEGAADKAGFANNDRINEYLTPASPEAIAREDVVDVTRYVNDGVLAWDVPPGHWRIIRLGYNLTGKTNSPATPEATGLEVDKLDPEAVKRYYRDFLQTYIDATHGMLGKGHFTHIDTDSYEAGAQNWTERMREEFEARRGYDLLPWLPTLTGLVVGSAEETERFLFDFRTCLGDMLAEYHYDILGEILAPYGLKRYTESHESWRANLADGMDCKRYADIPMGAIWCHYKRGMTQESREDADLRESASVSHIYGQKYVAAEAFTTNGLNASDGPFVYSPALIKRTADFALAAGVNRFVIHTSAHQPVEDKRPGLSLFRYGQWFSRHETWAEQARAWTDYLARSSYLLQQGRFVGDVAVYYGEDNNATTVFHWIFPEVPYGYAHDFVSPDILRHVLKAEGGLLKAPTGVSYKALALNNAEYMSMPVLRRLKELADAGIVIAGERPERPANLQADDGEFGRLVRDIWETGRANVVEGPLTREVMEQFGVQPDVDWRVSPEDSLRFVHRTLPQGEIYWVANLAAGKADLQPSFRVSGKRPVIWHAEDGSTEDVSYEMRDGRTVADLHFEGRDAYFVLFMDDTDQSRQAVARPVEQLLLSIDTPWEVSFRPGMGAPERATFRVLQSYTARPEFGIRYFSGTATYANTFSYAPVEGRLVLDLGDVGDLAEVRLNGKPVGTAWHKPFRLDVTDALQAGTNRLEVVVANVWNNRLIGDVQPGVTEKIGWTQLPFYKPDFPLRPAGLLGPVRLLQVK